MIKTLRAIISEEVSIEAITPENETFGHYSTNVAFRLAKIRGTSPRVIAEDLAKILLAKKIFPRVEVAGNGFLNIWLSHETLEGVVKEIIKKKKNFGKKKLPRAIQQKIQVEFISANPTGPLTLANGRGGFLGDALSNVLEAAGHQVEREYYVNDTGNQVRTLGLSLLAAQGTISNEENFYQGEYVKEWAKKNATIVKKYANKPEVLGTKAATYFLKLIKSAVEKKAGIHFDRYTSEAKDIHVKHFAEKALTLFKKKGFVYESEGAEWLKTTEFGDDKDRVLITREKLPTYFLVDAGHYLETKERKFTTKIIILGPDHYGYVKRIQAAASILELGHSEVLITQAVRLVRGGEEVKMSKRSGTFVTFEDLVEDVGGDVARFFFLMISPDTHMDFDLDLAKEQSLKNPVFYAQYAVVRTAGIIKKARVPKGKIELNLLTSDEDIRLITKLAAFPEVIEDTAKDFAVHRMTRYALDLAKAFHTFYEKERVGGVEPNIARARLELVKATQIVISNLFLLLGISTPKKM